MLEVHMGRRIEECHSLRQKYFYASDVYPHSLRQIAAVSLVDRHVEPDDWNSLSMAMGVKKRLATLPHYSHEVPYVAMVLLQLVYSADHLDSVVDAASPPMVVVVQPLVSLPIVAVPSMSYPASR